MYDNEYEIRVFGLKHAGQHAIINWIATLFREPVYFFNNCGWGVDPYRTGRTRGTRKKTILKDIFVRVDKLKNAEQEEVDRVRQIPKKCIIYSYEGADVWKINRESKPATPEEFIGKSEKIFDVLILRDIFNLASCTFKHSDRVFDGKDSAGDDEFLSQFDYKNYIRSDKLEKKFRMAALEFLGKSHYMREKKICISFNDWFLSKGYRECIAGKFGLENNEISLDVVAAVGNRGSKFDGMDYDGKARDMDVLGRWKHFEDNKVFWDILSEWGEAVELSNDIFGEIPGTMEHIKWHTE